MYLITEHDGRRFVAQTQPVEQFESPFGGENFPCLVWDHVGGTDFIPKQAFASQVISSGCRYAVCAGIDCSAWHDAFDLAWVQQHLNDTEEEKDAEHVMTSWHEGESIDHVAFFFVYNTNFDEHDFRQFLVLHLGDSPARSDVDAAVRRNALGEGAA